MATECGGADLVEEQMFWVVPDPSDDDGRFLVVCPRCWVPDPAVMS